MLWLWQGDGRPDYPRGADLPDEQVERLNDAVDLRLTGPDAAAVGEALGREWHPLYLYDVARERVGELTAEVERVAAREGLNASAEALADRVSHRERVAQALEIGGGAGIVSFRHEAVAVGGLPAGRPLAVRNDGGWLTVEAGEGEAAAELEIGPAPVDEGRLALVDLDELSPQVVVETGPGVFPVFRDLGAAGAVLRVRVRLSA